MKMLYGRRLGKLADRIEKEFFRIEREDKVLSSAVNGLIAGVAVGVVAWIVTSLQANGGKLQRGDLLIFACLGSSSASIVFAPMQRTNSLRAIVLAYLAASLVCVMLLPMRDAHWFAVPLQCAIAVAICITLMRLADAMHPAAVGSAMAFVIYDRGLSSLLLLMLAVIGLLAVVKVMAYTYREELTFRDFPREFRRGYYGVEMNMTLPRTNDDQADIRVQAVASAGGGVRENADEVA